MPLSPWVLARAYLGSCYIDGVQVTNSPPEGRQTSTPHVVSFDLVIDPGLVRESNPHKPSLCPPPPSENMREAGNHIPEPC